MSNVIIDSYTSFPVSDELWNQSSDAADMNFSTVARSAAYHIDTGSSLIGKTLKTFTLRMKSTSGSPGSNPTKFGVWAQTNATRTPDTEFTGIGAITDNTNQLSTSFVDYTFTSGAGHVLADADNIGFVPTNDTVADYQIRRAAGDTVADMIVAFFYTDPRWGLGSSNQIPYGYGSQD